MNEHFSSSFQYLSAILGIFFGAPWAFARLGWLVGWVVLYCTVNDDGHRWLACTLYLDFDFDFDFWEVSCWL